MRITISGRSKHVDTKIIRKALQWYGRELMPKLHKEIRLEVEIVRNLRKQEGVDGGAAWIGLSKRKPRDFCIEIDSALGMRNALKILAHEMVHVKQFAKREMIDHENAKHVSWHGKRYLCHTDDRYWTLPWEVEAYGLEPGLYYRFRRDTGI